jgi:hypothetical protein
MDFQNIFKQFFGVEIGVPAYINLIEIEDLRYIVKTNEKETKQFTAIQFEKFEMRCTIVHKILVEGRACVALLEQLKQKTFNVLAVPFLLAVCATFDDNASYSAAWSDDMAADFGNINLDGRKEIERVLGLINQLIVYYHQKLGVQQCPACGTCSSLTEAVGMLDAPRCTNPKCRNQALVCWNPPLHEHALGFRKLFGQLKELIERLREEGRL